MESWVQSWRPRTNAFCNFSSLSKLQSLPRTSDARSYEVLHLSRKIISANLKIWGSKMQPLSGNQRPDLRTALMNMSLVPRLPRKIHLCRSSSNAPRLPSFLDMLYTKPSRFARFWQGPQSLAPATRNDIWTSKSGASMWCFYHFDFETRCAPQRRTLFRHLNFQKWSEPVFFLHFEWKCASRHNGVHFFDIATSKSGRNVRCFVHFDLEMCFAPLRRALFRHLNFQKWSEPGLFCTFWVEMCFAPQRRALFRHRNFQKRSEREVFCAFWLGNVLRATTACNFSSLIWPAGSAPLPLFSSLLFSSRLVSSRLVPSLPFPSLPFASLRFASLLFSSLLFSSLLYSSAPPLFFICPYCRKFDF